MPLPILESSTSSLSLKDNYDNEPTFFESVLMSYFRDENFKLINSCVYRGENLVEFSKLMSKLSSMSKNNELFIYLNDPKLSQIPILVWEVERDGGIVGVVTKNLKLNSFNQWKINLVLSSIKIAFTPRHIDRYQQYTELIVEKFATTIKNKSTNDKWETLGRDYFYHTVEFFTSRGIQVEAILPAFPCKSSNLNKVSGYFPDKGEELAIKTICNFVMEINKVYPPGMVVYLVSDGHVFSDCIGVNDHTVDEYGESLKALYKSVKPQGPELIKFASLIDLFDLKKHPFEEKMLEGVNLEHYVETEIDETSELCRKILMKSCDTDCGELKKDIDTPGHPRLSLFRGFAKFMEEDLRFHPSVVNASRKKQKKIFSQVAFEMIKRNDAYSNLVELMFPKHLRFSIHAHVNSGPKFGIKLLSNETCQVVKSLKECKTPNYDDLLHIPTPWHNTVFKLTGRDSYFITRAEVIHEALKTGSHVGKFNTETNCFELSPV